MIKKIEKQNLFKNNPPSFFQTAGEPSKQVKCRLCDGLLKKVIEPDNIKNDIENQEARNVCIFLWNFLLVIRSKYGEGTDANAVNKGKCFEVIYKAIPIRFIPLLNEKHNQKYEYQESPLRYRIEPAGNDDEGSDEELKQIG